MFDYFLGLIDGASKYYNEKLEIKEIEKGSDFLKLKLTFEKDIYFIKKYNLNTAISFGVIKNINIKISVLTTIILSIINFAALFLIKSFNPTNLVISIVSSFVSSFIASSL